MPRRADSVDIGSPDRAAGKTAPPACEDAEVGAEGGSRGTLPDPPAAGCQQADTCPAAGRGHWLRHTDKDGQRTTVHNSDGTFWNRACPVRGCSVKVFG